MPCTVSPARCLQINPVVTVTSRKRFGNDRGDNRLDQTSLQLSPLLLPRDDMLVRCAGIYICIRIHNAFVNEMFEQVINMETVVV